MSLFHIVILALVQGITEFLPVSSSGHLVVAHAALGSNGAAADLTMDIAVHVGTLFAVLVYFRDDVKAMIVGLSHTVLRKHGTDKDRLVWHVILASLPIIVAGFVLHLFQPVWMRSLPLAAVCTILFGILLWWADRKPAEKTLETLSVKNSLVIGCAQILALVPGTSRSGITMTAARYLGFTRVESARFSLLLAIVAISGAGTLTGLDLWRSGDMALTIDALIAALMAFIAGWVAIALMMRWLAKASFTVFAVYRVIVGFVLLGLIFAGVL